MPQKSLAPLALEWLVFLRDHGQDLKLTKEARVLASVLPTYGEGKKIFATMVTLSKVTGMKRETVRNARRELQDKGLLEDITGDPDKQERIERIRAAFQKAAHQVGGERRRSGFGHIDW